MIKLFSAVLFLLMSVVFASPLVAINSTDLKLINLPDNLDKAALLNEAANNCISNNPEQAKRFNSKTFEVLRNISHNASVDSLYLEALYTKGLYNSRIQRYNDVISAQEYLYKIAIKKGLSNIAAKAMVEKAIAHEALGDYEQALDGYNMAMHIFEDIDDNKGVLFQFINVGLIHQYQKKYELAESLFNKAVALSQKIKFETGRIIAYNNLGISYQERGDYRTALDYFSRVLAFDLKEGDSINIGNSYNNIGIVYLGLKNYQRAQTFLQLSLRIKLAHADSQGYANTCNNMGETLMAMNNEEALLWLNKATRIATSHGYKTILLESYHILQAFYAQQKSYKEALEFNVKYHTLKDSLKLDNLNLSLDKWHKQYELERMAKKAVQQDAELIQQRNTEKVFVIVMLFLAVLAVFVIITLQRTKKLNKALSEQQLKIVEQNNILQSNNEELIYAKQKAEEATIAKSQFLSTVSHEIRTPLNAIIGLANLLNQNNPRDDQKTNLEVLRTSSNSLLAILNDVLDLSKLEAGKMQVDFVDFDLRSMVQYLFELFTPRAKEKGLLLTLDIDKEIPLKLTGDPLHINQVLSNIISNAIKFTDKGSVQIAIVLIQKTNSMCSISFSVSDTGIGIAPEKQQSIFENFTQADNNTTRNFGGTGLGLSISKKLLSMLNSNLELKSSIDAGSVFSFKLDFAIFHSQISTQKTIVNNQQVSSVLVGKQILVAEDNHINVFVIKQFLSKWNMQLTVAENGKQATELALANHYDIVLMDLNMPIMDGYEAAKIIIAEKPDTIILAITANQDTEVEKLVSMSGMRGVISKPFQPEQLMNRLQDALR